MSFSYNEITSRKNDKIIWASKLSDKKMRDKENVFFIEGVKLLREAVEACFNIKMILFTKKAFELYEADLESACADEYILVTDEVMEKLSVESAPQGIFSIIEKKPPLPFSNDSLDNGSFIILEDIQNPQNLGAIFRCAFSLGGKKLVLSKGCADVFGSKAQRASMGAILKSEFYVCDNIVTFIEQQKELGNRVYCTHLHSDSEVLGRFEFRGSDSIVIGNEGKGITSEVVNICTGSVIIPMTENAESLNASTAASILIWELNKAKLLP